MKPFRKAFSKEQRIQEYRNIREKYPDRVPVIIDPQGDLFLRKRKFLVEHDMLFSNLIYVIRQRLNVKPNESLFFFYENTIPCPTHTIGQILNERVSCDGFVVLAVAKENTFGAHSTSHSPCV